MEKRSILLALLSTAFIPLNGANCTDGFCRVKPVIIETVHPAMAKIGDFFSSLTGHFEGSRVPYLVVGGSGNYSTSSYPQFALYDLSAALLADGDFFGGTEGFSKNNESFRNYFWGVYGGYHVPLPCNWDIGIELGYKKLVQTKSTVNILNPLTSDLPISPIIPFRNTNTKAWDLLFALKYQSLSGFNLFLKAGGAKVKTVISQGNFIALDDSDFSGNNAFGPQEFSLVNIYPEVELGAGFRFLNHFEVHVSYAKIFAPDENDLISTSTIFYQPRKCPSIDIFTISLEMLLF